MKKVLITGAGGFIGSHLVEDQLRRNNHVTALDINLDRLAHLAGRENCQLVIGDIKDDALLKKVVPGIACIFHLASAHLEVSKSESFFWETNVNALKRFLAIADENGVKRFVHCSSVGVFGKLASLPADENSPCRPDILYEKTKLAGENEVVAFSKNHRLPIVVLRPAWVYGPRCPRTQKLFRTIKKGRFFMVGSGKNLRHPIYITDMSEAFHLAAEGDTASGEIFIIASTEALPLKTLVREIARVQGAHLPAFSIPLPLMRIMCALVERLFKTLGKEPPFSSRSLKFFTESSAFDISKAQKMLHFQPRIDLHKGLSLTNDWIKEHDSLKKGAE